ncbi:hypothetical protein QBC39DRAFT_365321, partial [Podospora conica]
MDLYPVAKHDTPPSPSTIPSPNPKAIAYLQALRSLRELLNKALAKGGAIPFLGGGVRVYGVRGELCARYYNRRKQVGAYGLYYLLLDLLEARSSGYLLRHGCLVFKDSYFQLDFDVLWGRLRKGGPDGSPCGRLRLREVGDGAVGVNVLLYAFHLRVVGIGGGGVGSHLVDSIPKGKGVDRLGEDAAGERRRRRREKSIPRRQL